MRMLTYIVWLSEEGRTYKAELLGAGLASLVTFLAGSFFDYSYRSLNPSENPTIWVASIISLLFLMWWYLSTNRIYRRLTKSLAKLKFKDPKIAVLSLDARDEKEVRNLLRATVYTPENWFEYLRSHGLKAQKITELAMKNEYSIIINPFGELYLEEDTTNMKTFQRIKEYIKKGGVFVNTVGLAFFYMWNRETKVEGLTGPMLETYSGSAVTKSKGFNTYESSILLQPIVIPDDSSLIDTWLYKNFGIRTTLGNARPLKAKPIDSFKGIVDDDPEVQEFRSALRCESSEYQLIPIVRCEYVYQPTGRTHECYPVAAVKYGVGYLILIGIVLKEEKDLSLVTKAIEKIVQKLSGNGSLESKVGCGHHRSCTAFIFSD